MPTCLPSAREVALLSLHDMETKGTFLHLTLPRWFARHPLPARERALTTELVYGTVRWQGTLDHVLASFSTRPLSQLTPWIRSLLRLGAYELLFLRRTSRRATCYEAVQLAKRYGHPGVARLVNAVLRRLSENRDRLSYPSPTEDPVGFLTARYSHPRWLVERWLQRWPRAEVEALCAANNEPAPVTVRVNRQRGTAAELAARWQAAGLSCQPCRYAPEGLQVAHAGEVRELPGFAEGWFTVQDEASQLVVPVLAPAPGARVVDVCSAPGAKATHLAEWLGEGGEVLAVDRHPSRLRLVHSASRRLGLSNVQLVCADGRQIDRWLRTSVDACLLDAPCSGTGTLRRRPDVRWRRQPEHLAELTALQSELLAAAAAIVKPGGVLVYSTCSLEPEENEAIVLSFRQAHPEFQPDWPEEWSGPEADRSQGWLRLEPHRHGTDGFFIARLRKGEGRG